MTDNRPDRAAIQLTDLQRSVYTLLLEHRYYSRWIKEPLVSLQQNWIAKQLNAKQAEISNALFALRRAKLLARCGTPQLARPQVYVIIDPAAGELPDAQARQAAQQEHIDPDLAKIRNTATPLSRNEIAAFEHTAG